jgi:hypothetical protein
VKDCILFRFLLPPFTAKERSFAYEDCLAPTPPSTGSIIHSVKYSKYSCGDFTFSDVEDEGEDSHLGRQLEEPPWSSATHTQTQTHTNKGRGRGRGRERERERENG